VSSSMLPTHFSSRARTVLHHNCIHVLFNRIRCLEIPCLVIHRRCVESCNNVTIAGSRLPCKWVMNQHSHVQKYGMVNLLTIGASLAACVKSLRRNNDPGRIAGAFPCRCCRQESSAAALTRTAAVPTRGCMSVGLQ
jgi:hypothetical protein